MNRQNRRTLKVLRILVDAGLFNVCASLTVLSLERISLEQTILLGSLSLLWVLLLAWQRVYSDSAVLKFSAYLGIVFGASLILGIVLLSSSSVWPHLSVSLLDVGWMVLSLVTAETIIILLTRFITIHLVKTGRYGTGIALIGVNALTQAYAETVQSNLRFGHLIRAVLGDADPRYPTLHPVAPISDLEAILREDPRITHVMIGLPSTHYDQLPTLFDVCDRRGVRLSLIPDAQRYLSARPTIDTIGNIAVMSPMQSPLDFIARRAIKRAFDVVFSLCVLVLGAPVFLVIALLVKLSSPGPVLFIQERIGRSNRPFKLYKFRSMRVIDHEGEWSAKSESRVTPLGHILRKFSLDELPQFVNVLKGEMSVVGPRPERPQFVERFSTEIPKYRLKHRVKPGITGLAQINGCRGDTSIPLRIQYDLTYIESWSLVLDLTIIARTILLGFIDRSDS